MACILVYVWVKEENVKEFIEITLDNATNSAKEEGNIRFDFVQNDKEPTAFTLLEVYETAEQAAAHPKTPHFLRWVEKAKDMMSKPFEVHQQRPLFVPKRGAPQ
eukprot:TRINITY_DN28396_c1_g4_i1.p1 TRINITY_DN28396_c1_g4~~TRINITY_DN28396_c1_g4_i1.p1  ORF type:complete len:122 (+),score=64.16 TRINITY_DN28396_c1_g4_i1:55-366(+)